MEGKRPHARFCDRRCKVQASDARRVADGRAVARDRARYEREAEHRRAYARRYLQENPERMRVIRRRRKGEIRNGAKLFTERDWARLLHQYRDCCAYCGQSAKELQREHVIPLCRGGVHSVGNILPACQRCNYAKGRKLLIEWRYTSKGGVTPQ
jgi:5-methylcytosine-specific restriction endonuclease McrA